MRHPQIGIPERGNFMNLPGEGKVMASVNFFRKIKDKGITIGGYQLVFLRVQQLLQHFGLYSSTEHARLAFSSHPPSDGCSSQNEFHIDPKLPETWHCCFMVITLKPVRQQTKLPPKSHSTFTNKIKSDFKKISNCEQCLNQTVLEFGQNPNFVPLKPSGIVEKSSMWS